MNKKIIFHIVRSAIIIFPIIYLTIIISNNVTVPNNYNMTVYHNQPTLMTHVTQKAIAIAFNKQDVHTANNNQRTLIIHPKIIKENWS